MNPGIYGAVAASISAKKEYSHYKKHISNNYTKSDKKIIIRIKEDELHDRILNLIRDFSIVSSMYCLSQPERDYELFKAIQKFNTGYMKDTDYIFLNNNEFEAVERKMYNELKEKYEK